MHFAMEILKSKDILPLADESSAAKKKSYLASYILFHDATKIDHLSSFIFTCRDSNN